MVFGSLALSKWPDTRKALPPSKEAKPSLLGPGVGFLSVREDKSTESGRGVGQFYSWLRMLVCCGGGGEGNYKASRAFGRYPVSLPQSSNACGSQVGSSFSGARSVGGGGGGGGGGGDYDEEREERRRRRRERRERRRMRREMKDKGVDSKVVCGLSSPLHISNTSQGIEGGSLKESRQESWVKLHEGVTADEEEAIERGGSSLWSVLSRRTKGLIDCSGSCLGCSGRAVGGEEVMEASGEELRPRGDGSELNLSL
jgi:hypothetical protein